MSLFTKIIFQFLILEVVLLIAIYHSLRNSEYADNEKESVEPQVLRYRRAIQSTTAHYCRPNQYYDQEEGRCLGVPGGGKVLHIVSGRSCGVNILKPHCKNPLYYHICKSGKSILAQCSSNQIFDNRHQRCVYYDTSKLTPSTIRPDDYRHYDHVQVPNCTKTGKFPVPDQCSMFYSCESNGHRLYQSVFKCPQNTGYQMDKGICVVLPDCENDNSVDTKVCVSDAPNEIAESPNSNKAVEKTATVETTSERIAETTSINDSLVKREQNENNTDSDIVSTTPVIDNPVARDYKNNNSDTDDTLNSNVNSSTQSASFSDETTTFQAPRSQAPSTESTREAFDETQKEDESINSSLGIQVTSAMTSDHNDALHSTATAFVTTTEYSANNMNTNVDNETADTALFSSVSYTLSELTDRTRDATTEVTEQYRNDDRTEAELNSSTETSYPHVISTASDIPGSSSIASVRLDEETQNTVTEQYKTDGDVTETVSNLSTVAVDPHFPSTVSDVPEPFSVNDASTQLGETQSATTEQYKNDNSAAALPNFTTKVIDQILTSEVNDVPATTSNPYSNAFDASTSASNVTVSQNNVDVNKHTTEELLAETTSSIVNLLTPTSETREITTQYLHENTDI